MIISLKGDDFCARCQKGFDPRGTAQTRKHAHHVFGIHFKTGGQEYRVRGSLCCICVTKVSNWQTNSAMEGRLQVCARIPFVPVAEM